MAGVTFERALWNNGYHRPDEDSTIPTRMGEIRGWYEEAITAIYSYCPDSRERAVAITELESSRMWAIMSLAVNTEDAPA